MNKIYFDNIFLPLIFAIMSSKEFRGIKIPPFIKVGDLAENSGISKSRMSAILAGIRLQKGEETNIANAVKRMVEELNTFHRKIKKSAKQ